MLDGDLGKSREGNDSVCAPLLRRESACRATVLPSALLSLLSLPSELLSNTPHHELSVRSAFCTCELESGLDFEHLKLGKL